MNSLKKLTDNNVNRAAVSAAFLAAYGFFQFAYPYHLIRREQMNLFLFDWDYIRQTYYGTGWFSRFVSDFLEQFFHLPVAGPFIVALLLTAIGVNAYSISRKLFNQLPSLVIAALFYTWSFMRETGNLYITRYTVVVAGYLSILLIALQFKKAGIKLGALVLLLILGVWALGSPYHKHYGKLWGTPRIEYDRIIGLDAEVARENWDKVLRLSEKDLYTVEASYCYNLAQAMKGNLGQTLFDHSQNGISTLLIRVATDQSVFSNTLAGEAWFQLGGMTIAEQSAIISLQASPKHTGARYILRLARVNLISGENAAAQKYLNILSKTLFYRKWAKNMMPGHQSEATRLQLYQARMKLAKTDFVHHSHKTRAILLGLLQAYPDNLPARNYLLCYDLMSYDLEQFVQDYTQHMIKAHIYQEAILIWLSQHNRLTEQNAARYGVGTDMVNRMQQFFRNPSKFRNTYWYYYMKALEESDQ
ncbi:MAG: hypothetical protein J5705_03610 [Bacteroidaceae bacterium]|nr:hypothetical protein [Bacteroidaceae bacterium]